MKRFSSILLWSLLMAVLFLAGAGAEELRGSPDLSPSTGTDLCEHQHLEEVFYFDHPEYRPLNGRNHLVVGSAVVNTVCKDCGAVLRSEVREDARQEKPHVFKKDLCVLCGQQKSEGDIPELTVSAEIENVLEAAQGADILIIRAEGSGAALILPAEALQQEVNRAGAPLQISLTEEENSIIADLHIAGAPVANEGIFLRLYGEKIEKVVFAGSEENLLAEEGALWIDLPSENDDPQTFEPYSEFPWLGNGTYTTSGGTK